MKPVLCVVLLLLASGMWFGVDGDSKWTALAAGFFGAFGLWTLGMQLWLGWQA